MVPLSENHQPEPELPSTAVYLSVDYYVGHKKISTQQKTTKVKQTSSVLMVSSTVTTTVALSTGESSCLSS